MSKLDFNNDGKIDSEDIKHILMRYEWIVFTGLLLTIVPMMNVLGFTNIDSDVF